jgi:hypothetical protein
MKHLFETAEELQQAHEALAHVEYLFVNRQNRSHFICINLLDRYYEGKLTTERRNVHDKVVTLVENEIYPYSTVESFLAKREYVEVVDIDPEVAHEYRVGLLAKLLKELA